MKSSLNPVKITDKNIKALVIPVFEEKVSGDEIIAELDRKLDGLITEVTENGEIKVTAGCEQRKRESQLSS